jgi:hypothetical protein
VLKRTAAAVLVYTVAACAFTWPLLLHPQSLFGAVDPTGDPSLNLWVLGWDLQTLSRHPGWFLNGRVFNAPMFFPAPRALAYSDHLLLQSLIVSPIYALTHDLVLCYNVLLLGSLVASALAMHVLVRELIGNDRAAFVAGLIFGFAPYHFTHLLHIQLQALYFLPLSFLFLHRVLRTGRRFDTIALGLVTGLQTISSVYYGVIGAIGLVCVAVTWIVIDRQSRNWRLLRQGALAAVVAAVIAAPWSIAYFRVAAEAGGGRNLYETANNSATLTSHLQAPATNLLYGRTNFLRPGGGSHLPFKDGPEQALFVGFVPLVLASIGLLRARGEPRTPAVYATLAIVGVLLSLGPNGIRPVYALLYRGVFGMSAIRAAARFDVLALVSISVLAALGIRRLETSAGAKPWAITAAVCALIAVEYCNGVIAFPARPVLTSNAGRWLKGQPGAGAVMCVPMGPFATNTPCMLQELEHGLPIVNGYSGLRPPFFEALADAANRLPDGDALLALHDLGVAFVVSDRALPLKEADRGALVERAAFDDQRVYQVTWSPELESRLSATTDISPPEPGSPPFVVGESAAYHVRWTSGPMSISAGDATIAVAPPQGSERYRFVVSAKTAPWMNRFYEADVRLETTASERLLPLTYRETIADGRRRTERQLTFDAARHEMKVSSGGTTITLPFSQQARDPISTLFYIRTLPIAAGTHVAIPLNDNGRRMRLDVTVDQQETIAVGDRSWPSWRTTPQLSERIDRRGALQIVAWLSADARRIPLVVEVSAAFGTARLELASYREK